MKIISTEALVGSLFIIGFDKIDPILYTYTLGRLTIDNQKTKMFQFEEKELSNTFNKYVDSSGLFFKLKEGYTLDTNVSPIKGDNWPLKNLFNKNTDLTEHLRNFDFSEIIVKKMELFGIDRKEQLNSIFSSKEIELIEQLNLNQTAKKLVKNQKSMI